MPYRSQLATTQWLMAPKYAVFPAGTIIPMYGSTPAAPWSSYSGNANNSTLIGVSANASLGVYTAGTGGTVSCSLGSLAGGHNSGFNVPIHSYAIFGGSFWEDGANNARGDHTHGGVTASVAAFDPNKINVTLYQTSEIATTIPAGSLAFCPTTYGTRYMSGGTTPLFWTVATGSGTTTLGTGNSGSVAFTSTGAGNHQHHGMAGGLVFSGANNTTALTTAGTHSHSGSVSWSVTTIPNIKFLYTWSSTVDRTPKTDVIVMWGGDITTLPAPWYLCDGNNGTINMVNFYLGCENSGSYGHGGVSSSSVSASGTSSSASWSHSHTTLGQNGANPPGGYGGHSTQSATHSHGASASFGTIPTPNRQGIFFIQYKG